MARSGQIQKLLGPECSIDFVQPTGDCFYDCVGKAIGLPTQDLREKVALVCDEETFGLFSTAFSAMVSGYEFMRRVRGVEELRSRLRVSGRDAGAGHCIWAESFAIQTVATELSIGVLILDEEVSRRSPESSRYVKILPEPRAGEALRTASSFVCLQRTRRQHFNLIEFRATPSSSPVIQFTAPLPARFLDLWNLSDRRECTEASLGTSLAYVPSTKAPPKSVVGEDDCDADVQHSPQKKSRTVLA